MKSVVVFCGSSAGKDDKYLKIAFEAGKVLAKKCITVIYGGAKVGLMGAVADGALQFGGKVIGVIPSFLKSKEVAHDGLDELIVVETMHARKLKMHELSEGVIALPGGFGTMEELFEMLTWAQLGLHKKPTGLLNSHNFYSPLIDQANRMMTEGFLKKEYRSLLLESNSILELLDQMINYQPMDSEKVISPATT